MKRVPILLALVIALAGTQALAQNKGHNYGDFDANQLNDLSPAAGQNSGQSRIAGRRDSVKPYGYSDENTFEESGRRRYDVLNPQYIDEFTDLYHNYY